MKSLNIISTILSALLLFSCATQTKKENLIFVSVLPQKFFVEKIAGDKFEVKVLVQPGHSPATYEPLPAQMIDLGKASAYFRIGVPFEKSWINRIASNNNKLKIIDTRKNIKLRNLASFEHMHDHDHPGHTHEEGEKDPHIWLDPSLVKIQAKNITDELCELDKKNCAEFRKNFKKFSTSLDSLDAELFSITASGKNNKFLVFHPSWGYFADRYNLQQFSIEYEGKEPSPKQLAEIINFAKDNGIKTIFVQKQFSTQSAETIATEIGGQVKTLDPLSEDYFDNLTIMAKTIAGNNE